MGLSHKTCTRSDVWEVCKPDGLMQQVRLPHRKVNADQNFTITENTMTSSSSVGTSFMIR